MALLLSNTVWEGTSVESRPTYAQGARDGHFYKELDTGETYIRINGLFTFINLGLSFIKATKSGKITTDANGIFNVVFVTPFISNIYTVTLTIEFYTGKPAIALFSNITNTGFTITTLNSKSGNAEGNLNVAWLATRDYNP